MKEELYVTISGVRSRVDLADDSGINLEFKSNLFGSLEDVTCSHSYSFALPFTQNNARVFDLAEDIRHESGALHKKIGCEYWVNGIPVFTDGNLYISEIGDDGYSCVMTWAVCTALQDLLDDDCNLNELPNQYAEVNTHFITLYNAPKNAPTAVTTINNTTDVIQPIYPANGYRDPHTLGTTVALGHSLLGVPVVPVRYILALIAQKYGITINLGNDYTGVSGIETDYGELMTALQYASGIETYGKDYAVSFGAIPLATRNLTDAQAQNEKVSLSFTRTLEYKTLGQEHIILLGAVSPTSNNTFRLRYLKADTDKYDDTYISDTTKSGYNAGAVTFLTNSRGGYEAHCAIKMSGKITAQFEEDQTEVSLKVYAYGDKALDDDNTDLRGVHEVTSITIEQTIKAGQTATFNFDDSEGYDNISIEQPSENDESYDGFFFGFTAKPTTYTANFIVYPDAEDRDTNNFIDIISNLPEVSVSDFVTFLFRSIGAFPVTKNGELYPIYYSDIEDNLTNNNVLDWSKKLTGAPHARPESIALSVDDYAQHNYFLMKSDDRTKSDAERIKDDDVWYKGFDDIAINDATIDKENECYTAPFNSAYEKDNNCPRITTGSNIKAYEYDLKEKTNSRCDVEPTYGILMQIPDSYVTFQVFMPFRLGMSNNESFRYMQEILNNPYIITENMMLNEIDLRELDYAKPVYLDKYNSYFAIVSISRGSDGICETKLLKL